LKDAVAPLDALEDGCHLLRRQHHGEPFRTPCPHRVKAAQIDLQHLPVQEHQGIEGLVLCAGRDVPVYGQVGEKLLHLDDRFTSPQPVGTVGNALRGVPGGSRNATEGVPYSAGSGGELRKW